MNRRRSLILASVVGGTLFTGGAALALNVAAASPSTSTPPIGTSQWSLVDDTHEVSTTQSTWVLLQEPAPEDLSSTTTTATAPPDTIVPPSPTVTSDDHGGQRDDAGNGHHATGTTVEDRHGRHDDDEAEHEAEHEQEHEHEHEDEPGDD